MTTLRSDESWEGVAEGDRVNVWKRGKPELTNARVIRTKLPYMIIVDYEGYSHELESRSPGLRIEVI